MAVIIITMTNLIISIQDILIQHHHRHGMAQHQVNMHQHLYQANQQDTHQLAKGHHHHQEPIDSRHRQEPIDQGHHHQEQYHIALVLAARHLLMDTDQIARPS